MSEMADRLARAELVEALTQIAQESEEAANSPSALAQIAWAVRARVCRQAATALADRPASGGPFEWAQARERTEPLTSAELKARGDASATGMGFGSRPIAPLPLAATAGHTVPHQNPPHETPFYPVTLVCENCERLKAENDRLRRALDAARAEERRKAVQQTAALVLALDAVRWTRVFDLDDRLPKPADYKRCACCGQGTKGHPFGDLPCSSACVVDAAIRARAGAQGGGG